MFRFAHLSDPHIMPLPIVSPRQLAGKRFLGYLSWHRKRKKEHRKDVLDALCRDLREAGPDHICVTGDLTNISLPAEFDAAADWLAGLGEPSRVSVIPGNHDAYVRGAIDYGLERFAPWMSDDDCRAGFPYVRRRGPVDFIGTSTAVATWPLLATGKLGNAQRERLKRRLSELDDIARIQVLMIHHSPHPLAENRRKALSDQVAVRALLAASKIDFVLHGHGHHQVVAELPGRDHPVNVLGAGSASTIGIHDEPAQYYLVDIEADDSGMKATVHDRRYEPDAGRFRLASRFEIERDHKSVGEPEGS